MAVPGSEPACPFSVPGLGRAGEICAFCCFCGAALPLGDGVRELVDRLGVPVVSELRDKASVVLFKSIETLVVACAV